MEKVQKDLNDIERKLNKCNKIAEKGEKIGYADAIKLGRKSNSIVSTIKKCIKDYDVSIPMAFETIENTDTRQRAQIPPKKRARRPSLICMSSST